MKRFIGIVVMLATALSGCNRGSRTTTTAPSSVATAARAPGVDTISIAGSSTLSRGARVQLRAFAQLTDGDYQEITSRALWSADNPAVATIEPEGWITGTGAGTSRVSAQFNDVQGLVTVTVSGGLSASEGSSSGSGQTNPDGPSSPSPTPTPCLPRPLPSDPPPPIPCPFPLPIPVR